jgi:hypothetical protein
VNRVRRLSDPIGSVLFEDLEILKDADGSEGCAFERPSATDSRCAFHKHTSASIYQCAIDQLTIVEVNIIDDDGFVSYGPIPNLFFHNVRILQDE